MVKAWERVKEALVEVMARVIVVIEKAAARVRGRYEAKPGIIATEVQVICPWCDWDRRVPAGYADRAWSSHVEVRHQ